MRLSATARRWSMRARRRWPGDQGCGRVPTRPTGLGGTGLAVATAWPVIGRWWMRSNCVLAQLALRLTGRGDLEMLCGEGGASRNDPKLAHSEWRYTPALQLGHPRCTPSNPQWAKTVPTSPTDAVRGWVWEDGASGTGDHAAWLARCIETQARLRQHRAAFGGGKVAGIVRDARHHEGLTATTRSLVLRSKRAICFLERKPRVVRVDAAPRPTTPRNGARRPPGSKNSLGSASRPA